MNVNVYDRADNSVRTITPAQLLVFVHTDELNGEDSVHISTLAPLAQGERLVWTDKYGAAHEHVCQNPKVTRELGTPIYSDTAINSICDTFGDIINALDASNMPAASVFQRVIKETRFTGSCATTNTFPAKTVLSRKTARECIREVLKLGGDLETKITASAGGVVARECNIVEYRGHTGGHKRFTYGKDLIKVERTEHSAVITACYGYGKTIETKDQTGGKNKAKTKEDDVIDKPRVTVYVTDEDARAKYGIGGRHLVGKYENTQCDDRAQLERETREYLKAHNHPQVTYEADVVDLASMGREWEGVDVGDSVDIVDTCFSPALRCRGRVTKIVRNVLADTATVTLGNVTDTLADQFMTERDHLQSLQRTIDNLGEPDPRKDSYLKKLVEGLNRKFNENGASYHHIDFHTGSTWASVPMDENGKPTREGGWAINISPVGFRIASKRRADGSWDWTTFGTGEGFVADSIVSGSLDARLICAGVLTDRAGKNYWNLDTGRFYTQDARADHMSAYDMNTYRLKAYEGIVVNPNTPQQIDIGVSNDATGAGVLQVREGGKSYGYVQLAYKGLSDDKRGVRIAGYEGVYISGSLRVSTGNENGPWVTGHSFGSANASVVAELFHSGNRVSWSAFQVRFEKGICTMWEGAHGGWFDW